MLERLESRQLLSADLQNGVLDVTGGDGNDNIRLVVSGDQLVVQEDSGDSSFALSDVQKIHVRAGDGDDHVQLDADVPAAEIEGEGGGDTLLGGDGDDTLEGGAGDDHLDGKGGADVLDGGGGFDSADYRLRTENLFITLNDQADDGAGGGNEGDNVLSSVERIVGGSGDDIIVGDDSDNSVSPGAGNDTVSGGGGNDSLDGDDGNDWLIGEGGDDRLIGGAGRDLVEGRSGDDTFVAQDGQADTIEGGTGNDTLETADTDLDQWNDVENAPHTAASEITVLRGKVQLVDGKSDVDFGDATRGETGPSRTLTIRNDGDAALDIGSITIPDGFTLVEDVSGNIAPGDSQTFTIRMNTDDVGDQSGTVRIRSNDANEDPFTFTVSGKVDNAAPQLPEITVLRNGSVIDDGQDNIGFGTVTRGATGPTQTFIVRNDGKGTLKLGNLELPGGFSILDDLAGSIAPGGSDQFTLRLNTGSAGNFSGQVRFTNNDENENPFTFDINGLVQDSGGGGGGGGGGGSPEITVRMGSKGLSSGRGAVKFGKAAVGASGPSKTFTIKNDGNAALKLNGVFVPRGYAIVEGLTSSLSAGQSDSFTIRMLTSKSGSPKGTIKVTNNDSNENPFVIKVNGSVAKPAKPPKPAKASIAVTQGSSRIGNGATVNFGNVTVGRGAKDITLKIANGGNASLALGSVRAPAGFTLIKAPPKNLAPHKSTTITFRLNDSGVGTKSGTITLGSGSARVTFTIRGVVLSAGPAATPDIGVFNGSTRINDGQSSAINFGTAGNGAGTRSLTFKVTNEGKAALHIGTVTVPGGYTITEGLSSTLNAGASDTFTIRLNEGTAGTKSGSVNVSSNDPNENPFNFAITGQVAASGGGGGGGGTVNGSVDSAGTLIIRGTGGNDTIIVKGSGNSATVTENGATKTFNGVKKIGIDAGEGNDNVNLSGISLPSAVDGKGGADTLIGGGGADVLHGGFGNDSIVGGFGADQLFGDDGDDKLDAVDGTSDTQVDGGAGNDTIKADPTDSKTGT